MKSAMEQGLLKTLWVTWATPLFLIAFIATGFYLAFLRQSTFHSFMFDQGLFTQVIWNTARGNWFATSLKGEGFLGNHFTVAAALLAPLFWIVPDGRILLFVEQIVFATAILPGYWLLREKYPMLAPGLTLAFILNPLVHQVSSDDFQGIMLVVLPLAIAFYAIHTRRIRWLALATVFALLVREDVGIYIACLGLYISLFAPVPRRYGIAMIIAGAVWLMGLTTVVIPRLGSGIYPHFGVIDLGGSVPEITRNILSNPMPFLQLIFMPEKIGAFARVMGSMGWFPLIAAGEQVLWAPSLIIFFASPDITVGTLQHWWIAPLLPLFWGSIALTIKRLNTRWATLASGFVLISSLVGFFQWSQYPFGGQYEPERYQASPRDQAINQALAILPPNASVAVTNRMGPHVATREKLSMYPWYSPANVDWVVVDEHDPAPYPLTPDEMHANVIQLQSDVRMYPVFEKDGVFVFRPRSTTAPTHGGNWNFDPYLRLDGYDLALTNAQGIYQSDFSALVPDRKLQLSLYWTALSKMPVNYSISVQLQTSDGQLITQDDAWPIRGTLSTMTWKPGQTIRDAHYLDVPSGWATKNAKLVVLIYESDSGKPIAPVNGYTLTDLQWQ